MLDLVMPGLTGHGDAEADMRQRGFTQPVIVLTATGGIDTVVAAMQAGAQDFFVKPASPERIIVSIRNALCRWATLRAEVDRLKKQADRPHHLRRPDRLRPGHAAWSSGWASGRPSRRSRS